MRSPKGAARKSHMNERHCNEMKGLLRPLLIAAGIICVILGVIALAIPLVPTGPFLLAAAACFARSWERFYNALLNNRWVGPAIRNYRERGGLDRRKKMAALLG